MRTLTIKASGQIFVEISKAAEACGVAKSEIVRERLAHGSTKRQLLWNRMADFVLADKDVPADLSANQNHLLGYRANHTD
jgi:hypothetical protein